MCKNHPVMLLRVYTSNTNSNNPLFLTVVCTYRPHHHREQVMLPTEEIPRMFCAAYFYSWSQPFFGVNLDSGYK